MINREMVQATLLTYAETLDALGQKRKASPSEASIEVTKPKLYNHSQVEDIRFQDVTDTCLSFNKNITEKNEIKIGNTVYLVNFVNNEGRLSQLFLKKKI